MNYVVDVTKLNFGVIHVMRILSSNEIAHILGRCAKDKPFMILSMLAKTGVRVSELISITPQDILFDEKQIIIHGKGDKIRNIDVPNDLLILLRIFVKNKHVRTNKRIFPVTRDAVYKMTKKIARTNPHTFRHSYAVELLRKTRNIRYVQVQLGHSSLSTTQVYLRFMDFSEDKKKLAQLWK